MFDHTKTVTVEGVVKKWELTNPHSWLWVEVKGKDGKVVMWGFEAEGPSTLARAGIKPSDFKTGTELTITGNPMRNGEPAGDLDQRGEDVGWEEVRPEGGICGEVGDEQETPKPQDYHGILDHTDPVCG